ncbi:MAG: FHA domain-containing protein [Actinobacteria bacterium]|nr:FHA domain-containing protein [Actinomycetota bacterium]
MNLLKRIENRLEKLFNEIFSRTEKSSVKPIEMAFGITKEMHRRSVEGIKRTYSPNIFTIKLNSADYENVSPYKNTLTRELTEYIFQYAAENNLHFIDKPEIIFKIDETVAKGKMSIEAEMLERTTQVESSLLDGIPEDEIDRADVCERTSKIKVKATPILIETTRSDTPVYPIYQKTTVGRSQDCDIMIDDIGVSRHHLMVTTEVDGSISIEDLGSTNGTYLNGEMITSSALHNGDEIVIGKTKLLFRINSRDEAS